MLRSGQAKNQIGFERRKIRFDGSFIPVLVSEKQITELGVGQEGPLIRLVWVRSVVLVCEVKVLANWFK